MKTQHSIRRILNFVGGLLLASCCFLGSYLTFQNGWTTLNKVDIFEGEIIDKGIMNYQTSSNGRYQTIMNKQAFFVRLKGLKEIPAVYNPQQKYSHLENSLNVGDTIKVFYNQSNIPDQLNLETFKIEKHNQVILNSQDYQGRERLAFYLTLIGGFVLVFLTFYQDRKFKMNG